jgi:glycosyltransferase involved in cell wall biosynthesis
MTLLDPDKTIMVASIAKIEQVAIDKWQSIFQKEIQNEYIYDTPTVKSKFNIHYRYIKMAIKIARNRKKYDYIIFWQQFIGIYYAVFTRLFWMKRNLPQSLILTFIYLKRPGFFGRLYYQFMKYAFNASAINSFVCHSSSEHAYYNKVFKPKNKDKVIFCRVGEGTHSELNPSPADYYFSGGGSNRDYATVIEAFAKNGKRLSIACKPENMQSIAIPPNVSVYHDAYGNDFFELIRNSKAAIVLVENKNISAGQLVILHAMRYGKPLFVTEGNSMKDYTDESYSYNVAHKSVDSLIKAIDEFEESEKNYKEMSEKAFETYNRYYTLEKYAERIAKILLREFD